MQDTKTAQHTPGPWPLERTTVNMGGFNVAVFRVTIPDWTPLDLMNEPDARLIAAAPDLLEALRTILTMCGSDDAHIHSLAHAAIAKATGGQQ